MYTKYKGLDFLTFIGYMCIIHFVLRNFLKYHWAWEWQILLYGSTHMSLWGIPDKYGWNELLLWETLIGVVVYLPPIIYTYIFLQNYVKQYPSYVYTLWANLPLKILFNTHIVPYRPHRVPLHTANLPPYPRSPPNFFYYLLRVVYEGFHMATYVCVWCAWKLKWP